MYVKNWWFYDYFVFILWNSNNVMGGEMETILRDFHNFYKLDFVTIITDRDVKITNETKDVYNSMKAKILHRGQFKDAEKNLMAEERSGLFVFGSNSSESKIVLEELFRINESIFSVGSWFVFNLDNSEELDVKISFDSNFNVLKRKGDTCFDLLEVYDIPIKDSMKRRMTTYLGSYCLENIPKIKTTNQKKRRSNLMGKLFRLVFVPYANGNHIVINATDDKLLKNEDWKGMIPDIVNALSKYLNFTYSIAISRDGKYGKFDAETDEWNGLVKDIIDDVADIAVASLSITKSRSQVVDFMIPFESEENCFLVSMRASFSWTTFLHPFLYESWAALLVMLVSLSLVFAFVARIGNDECLKEFTLEKCAIYVFGAYGGIAVRRWSITPSNISAR